MTLELKFSIDKVESDLTGMLVIALSQPITLDQIRVAALHRELLQLLHAQESTYQSKIRQKFIGSNTPLSLFHVSNLAATRILKLLAATHLFYFGQKLLVCDFHSMTEFYYYIEACDKNQPTISGRLKENDFEFPLSDVQFLCSGSHHYYVHGIRLKQIVTEVAWKDLKQLYIAPEKVSLAQIQKEYSEDHGPLQPKLVYSQGAEATLPMASEPLPLLILSDRLGAFADLWMNYPQEHGESLRVSFSDPSPWVKDAKGKPRIKRQFEVEKNWERDLLETDFVRKISGNTHYYCPVDAVGKSLSFLLEIGWHLEDFQGRRICRLTDSDLQIHSASDSFIVKGRVHYGEHHVDLKDIVGAFNRRDRFVQIGVGQVGLLPTGFESSFGISGITEEGEIVQDGIKLQRNRLGALTELFDSSAKLTFDDTFANLKEKLSNFAGIIEAPPSSAFRGELRPYQQEGLNWLAFLYEYGFHGLLADDMGLGKTVQVLAFLSRLKLEKPVLIVLPTSLIFNWKHEIEQFLPDARIYVYQGQQRTPWPSDTETSWIILTSYATLRIDLDVFQSHSYQCIILDEAQTIKNSHTKTAQSIYQLEGDFRLSLTGTPIENHIAELWAHFRFLIPDLFGPEKTFLAEAQAGTADFRYLQKIRRKMRPFLMRRTKEEVAKDLPDRIEQVVFVEMEPAQRKIYDEFLTRFKSNLLKKIELEGIGKHRIEVLEVILRLRQICCHPLLISGQLDELDTAASSKLEALMQDLETAVEEGRKVLVYSQFTSMLQLISKEVKARNWQFVYLDGQTKDREKAVRTFQEDPATLLFLISLKAGGIGLNLTAADYVFLYDPWWNEAVENQAIDRAHRIGRKDTVIAKRYVAAETIEEKMMTLKASKRSLLTDILHDQIAVDQLSIDDLHYLID